MCPMISFGQKSEYFSFALGYDLPSGGHGYGVTLTGNGMVVKGLYFGGGIGYTKFKNLSISFIPLIANITLIGNEKKIHPIIFLQPGYGVLNGNEETKGGFFFNGNIGIGFPGKVSPFFALGYSRYAYTSFDFPISLTGFAMRAGIRLK